ncbi:MAG: GxxExxY protein [Chitinophagales bacterium]|nr:GxxExxY protein [Chitinophagales bacterium]
MDELTERIIGCAIKVHKELGPGLLESAYLACLLFEMEREGLSVKSQCPLPLIYHDVRLSCGYRADLIVNNRVIVEVKAVDALNDIHLAQVLTYLKLSNCRIGLLINFNVVVLKHGLKRVINNFLRRKKN